MIWLVSTLHGQRIWLISTPHGLRTRQHVICRGQALQLALFGFWQGGCKLLGVPTRGFGSC